MRGIFILLIIILCGSCVSHKTPAPQDSEPPKNKIDWLQVYEKELIIARENDDVNAWIFFWPEYLKELKKRHK